MQKTNEKSNPAGGRTIKSLSLNSDSKGTIPKSSGNLLHILGKSKGLKTTLDCFYKYMPQPLVVYDSPRLGIVYANPAFLSLYEYTNKDVTELTIKDLFNSCGEEASFQQRYNQLKNARYSIKAIHVKSSGVPIKVKLHRGSVEVSGHKYHLILINEVTGVTKLEEEKKLSREINIAIGRRRTYKDGLNKVLNCIRAFARCDLMELWLFSQENDYALIEASSYRKNNPLLKKFVSDSAALRICKDQIMEFGTYASMQPFWVNNLEKQSLLIRSDHALKSGLRSFFMLPITNQEKLIGGLFIFYNKEKEYDKELVDILSSTAVKQLRTEILNRRAFDELESFFQLSGELLCITGMNRCFKKLNQSFSRLLGFTEKELLGCNFIEFVHEDDRRETEKAIDGLIKQRKKKEFSIRFRCSNGDFKWLSWSVAFSEDHQLLIAAARDITSQRKAQEELVYKDKLLSVITEAANSLLKEENYHTIIPGILQNLGKGTSSDRVYVIEKNRNESGLETSRLIFEWCSAGIEPHIIDPEIQDTPSIITQAYFEEMKEGVSISKATDDISDRDLQTSLKRQNIKTILIIPIFVNLELWGFVGFDNCCTRRTWSEVEVGILKTFSSSLANAIERKKAEEAILESESRFRQMADTAPVMIWVSDKENNTVYVNKSWLDFSGVSIEELNKNNWTTLLHPDDVQEIMGEFNKQHSLQMPVHLEYRLKSANGDYRWVIDQAIPRFLADGTFLGYIGSVIDIHDRKLSEEKVRYQALVMQEVTEAIISTDLHFNVITWNKGAEMIHGIRAEEIVDKPLQSLVNYDYINETLDQALMHLYSYDYWAGEVYFDRRDGRRIYLHSALSFITNNKGIRVGIVGVHRDITDRRKSEEALRISEERYRSVVHALGEGIMLQDRTGKIITTNRSAEIILSLSSDQLKGQTPIDTNWVTIHEDGSPFPPEQHPSMITLQTGQSLQNIITGIHKPDGSLTWISINTEPLFYSNQRIAPDAVVSSFIDITQKKTAEMELQRSERQLREYSDRINNILDSITDGFIAVDNEMKVFLWNRVFEKNTGIRSMEAMGKKITDVFPELLPSVYDEFVVALRENRAVTQDYYIPKENKWLETTAFPSSQGLFIYFRDITKRKRQESLLALEKEVLELNARPQASLAETADFLLEGIEKMFPGIFCSVVCLKEDGKTVETLSAPAIPPEYSQAINELIVGPNTGACGTAIYLKQNVIVEDIAAEETCESYKKLALGFQWQACWSFPILSSQGRVLAVFSVNHTLVKSPSPEELLVFERTVNILRVIIENKQSEEKIKISNERYLLATMATNDAIWDWDVATNNMYWGEGFHGLFGYKAGYFNKDLGTWEAGIHPQDKERLVKSMERFVESNSQQVWQEEYRFRKADGKYVLVADRGFLIYNQQGKVSRMVGSMQDITEKREMEKKLLRQELNKQKLIAQAVVDAQEKERSLIGKELHDNINQILSTAKLYLEVARNDDKERESLITMSTHSISNAINEIRTISRSLVPSSIGDLGLVESIQDLVESIKLTRKLNVEFYHHSGIDELMSEQQKLMLFRITQEQVNNVIKHANAQNLVIELISEDETINISISDDGQGFDADLVKPNKGVGLSNITSRAELFNGIVKIETAPGKGCTLNIYIPISNL